MNIEHRLHHAARELREYPIAVPPLDGSAPAQPRTRSMAVPMLVPMLFVVGALFAVGGAGSVHDRSTQSDIPAVSPTSVDPAAVSPTGSPPVAGAGVAESPGMADRSELTDFQPIAGQVDVDTAGRSAEAPFESPADAIERRTRYISIVRPI